MKNLQSASFKIWILTLLPQILETTLKTGVLGRAFESAPDSDSNSNTDTEQTSIGLNLVQISDFSPKNFKGVDDAPYGGGAGMVMRADVLKRAFMEGVVEAGNYGDDYSERLHVIYPSPRGKVWNNQMAREMAETFWNWNPKSSSYRQKDLVFICGRYEGVDERFIEKYVDQEISIGDFVLTGAELAVSVMVDSAFRFVPGILGNNQSGKFDSFENDLLEHPQYTRPRVFDGLSVPDVLLLGNHQKIEQYRLEEQLRVTKKIRPDLLLNRAGEKGSDS